MQQSDPVTPPVIAGFASNSHCSKGAKKESIKYHSLLEKRVICVSVAHSVPGYIFLSFFLSVFLSFFLYIFSEHLYFNALHPIPIMDRAAESGLEVKVPRSPEVATQSHQNRYELKIGHLNQPVISLRKPV